MSKHQPPSLDEFREQYRAEQRSIARQLAELYIQGNLPRLRGRPQRRPKPKAEPELLLPGMAKTPETAVAATAPGPRDAEAPR
jgi:hypothetical protein